MKTHLPRILISSVFLLAPAIAKETTLPPTAEQQKAMTPQSVLDELMAGNGRYVAGKPTAPNLTARIEATRVAQYPKAFVLSCVDSRIPVEKVFDQGIGDIFVGRVAGNIETVEQLGSIEFATKLSGAKLVLVLGHDACGAIKGACDGVKLGNLTALLAEMQPAVDAVEGYDKDQRTSKNAKFVDAVVEKNVRITVANIRERSPVLTELENSGDIKIVGAVYSLANGKVTLLDIPKP